MNIIYRHIARLVNEASEQFPVILMTGARQVGKTTLLKSLDANRTFVTLDDPIVRDLAQHDPAGFMQTYRPPVLIDEFQYAPGLLPYIKMAVDHAAGEPCGQYWLTGSQQFTMMRTVSESLAGRAAILPLGGITQGEEFARPFEGPFSVNRKASLQTTYAAGLAVYERIWRGFYPAIVSGRIKNWQIFYRSYLNTYLERDVRQILAVSDESRFLMFIKVIAARTGNLLNLSGVAKDVGISQPTAKAWLSILESSGIVFLLRPYSANLNARIVKTPKVYFMDTGLCCYLTGWTQASVLSQGAMNGAILETYVVSEIVRSFWNAGEDAPIWFYRDRTGTEIDLLIAQNGELTPLEIKRTATPCLDDIRNFKRVIQKGLPLAAGALICLADRFHTLPGGVKVIPVGSL